MVFFKEYLASPERTPVEIAAAVAVLILEAERTPNKVAPDHPGLVSLDPLRVSVPARSVAGSRIPGRVWQTVAERSGLSVRRCRQAIALLRLPDEALALIHTHLPGEAALRPILRMTDTQQQIAAVAALVDRLPPGIDQPPADDDASGAAGSPAAGLLPPADERLSPHNAPTGTCDLPGLLASVTPIYAILSQASPDQRQAWAEWLGRDEPAIDFFATLLGAVDELHQLLKPVDGAGEADAAVTAGRPDKQRDRPHKEMSRCPDAEFYHLVTLVLALQRWLRTRPPAARQALGQQLRQSDRMDDADLLASTAGHLYRLLAAAVAQPDSHHLDELVGEDYVVHGCSHPASCRQAAMLADQRDGRP